MPMDVTKLKEIGKDIVGTKPKSELQSKVLAIVKANTKSGKALTQKEIAGILSKQMKRDIAPQQARSALIALQKKEKVVRRVLDEPDEEKNSVFWYAPS